MINVEQTLSLQFPSIQRQPKILRQPLVLSLKKLFHEKDINTFLTENPELESLAFVEKVLDYFNVQYALSNRSRENIPASGRVIIYANHPLGALDALSLIQMVSEVRKDIKVMGNTLLYSLPPMRPLLIPVDNLDKRLSKASYKALGECLNNEEVLIIFPAGEVSRFRPSGIVDGEWTAGFIKLAKRFQSDLLPVHLQARNSWLFYSLSAIYKPLSSLLLVQEMFWQRNVTLPITVGDRIAFGAIKNSSLNERALIKALKKHLYRIAQGKKGLFATERAIAHPVDKTTLRQALRIFPKLGETKDGKAIYLVNYQTDSPILSEIGRLREISFRQVGEGTGKRRDLDRFDKAYDHLVLWDDEDLEIVGAYRVMQTAHSQDELYTQTLFHYSEGFDAYRQTGLELGRSFIQPKYWGSRALDYLWQGIGAYLRHNPQVRYLFGPVSIPAHFGRAGINRLVHVYNHHFNHQIASVSARTPYQMSDAERQEVESIFTHESLTEDIRTLKEHLGYLGLSIPTLYKQYVDVFEPEGIHFLDWNLDADFGMCVDGFLLADLSFIKPKYAQRYLNKPIADSAQVA